MVSALFQSHVIFERRYALITPRATSTPLLISACVGYVAINGGYGKKPAFLRDVIAVRGLFCRYVC